jgi:DNA-directed RNA polymerase subunit F
MAMTMEAYRTALSRTRAVARLSEAKSAGQNTDAIITSLINEQRALAATLTDPAVVKIAGDALLKAQGELNADSRYHTRPVPAHETMAQIMKRRAAEAEQFAKQLSTPDYVAALSKLSPDDAKRAVPTLREVKLPETINELLHLENGAPQVIAHIDAQAKGTMLEHDALARVYAADGPLHDAMMKGLAQHLPGASREAVHQVAATWLGDREAAAKIAVELCSNDGEAYLEAVRQSTAWHRAAHEPKPDHGGAEAESTPTTNVTGTTVAPRKSLREIEREKDANKKAEDVAYTINHALSCGTTDVVLQPLIAAAFGVNVGCAHPDHSHDHDHGHTKHHHDHPVVKPKITLKTFAHEAGHYLKGEIIGDFAAVPLTIAVQRNFPNFMNGIRKIFEPLLGWAFRGGANRTARHWAQEKGIAEDAPETRAHAAEIYEHEVSHLPQAVVWNLFAYPIGAIGQKLGGHGRGWGEIFQSKLVGAVISNSILIGGRMVAPGAAQKWDTLTGDNIFAPVSKKVGRLFGVDEDAIEKANQKQRNHGSKAWAERVEAEPEAEQKTGAAIQ